MDSLRLNILKYHKYMISLTQYKIPLKECMDSLYQSHEREVKQILCLHITSSSKQIRGGEEEENATVSNLQ